MLRSASILALLLAVLPGSARAQLPQTPLFRGLGPEQGLPSAIVNVTAQDAAGYLWVGTGDGLARFDGVGFRVWQHEPQDPASLASNVVQALHVAADDRLWLGSEGGGLSVFDAAADELSHYNARTDPRFALDDVWAIASDADGVLWFGGFGGGLQRYDPRDDTLQVFRHDPQREDSLASDHVIALAFDAGGQLWIGTTAGLDRFDRGRFAHLRAGAGGLSAAVVSSLLPEADGSLLVGTQLGVDRRAADGVVTPQFPWLGPITANALARDRHGSLWIASPVALFQIDGERWQKHDGIGARREDARHAIQHVHEDHEGGLWVATIGGGLQRLAPDWRNFAVLTRGDAARGGLANVQVRASAESADGALWVVGARPLLDRVTPDGLVSRHLDQRLGLGMTWSVLETSDGAVWIGMKSRLVRYRPRGDGLASWELEGRDAVGEGAIDLLAEDADSTLWLAMNGVGLQRRALGGRVLADLRPGDGSGLAGVDTQELLRGPDDALWLANEGGLQRIVRGGSQVETLRGAPTARIHGFDFAADGTLWIATLGALERYRLDGSRLRRVERVDQRQGLPAVEAGGLRVDANGDVWLTSLRGLWHWSSRAGELRQLGVRDGLPSNELANRPPLRTRAGTIAVGSGDGLVWFDPRRMTTQRALPRLRLQGASVRRGGHALALDPARPLALRHDDGELAISARLLSFADPRSHRYRFRLGGLEREWIDDADGERSYTQLAPGSYQLQIVAAGADGVWSAPPLALAIEVAPPWWATMRARIGYVAIGVLSLLLAALVYRRLLRARVAARLVRQRHEVVRRASEAKSVFLATLGHEIRTPMTGVLGMAELLLRTPLGERQHGYASAIQRSGELLLRLVNDALDLARIEAGRLELAAEPVDLSGLLEAVVQLQQAGAERKALRLHTRIADDAPRFVVGDALRLQQIALNLVGNALKFTEQGGVELALEAESPPHTIALVVADTGPGLGAEQRARLFRRFSQGDGAETTRRYGGSGLGLAICQELAAAMGGRIEVDSEPGQGTTFRVLLPLPACSATDATSALPTPAAPAPGDARARRVLLVEDDATVAEVIVGLLEANAHAVTHVGHGLAALAEVATQEFDVALLDLDLPGIDGLELARLLRRQGRTLPLVAITARADPEAEPMALASGMQAFLRKPVAGAQLARVIDEVTDAAG